MHHYVSYKKLLIGSAMLLLAMVPLCFFLPGALGGDECEIVKAFFYERKQGEIVTDWHSGIPYRRYQTMNYPCATLTIKDNSGLMYEKEVEVTAIFVDHRTAVKKVWCDRKQGEDGEIYACIACFESDAPVSKVTCTFK